MSKREFSIHDEYHYNQTTPRRWIIAHIMRYKYRAFVYVLLVIGAYTLTAYIKVLIGDAFTAVGHNELHTLINVALSFLIFACIAGLMEVGSGIFASVLSQRIARDAREELYLNLLGKSQTFHNRQRVGDIMTRAANDTGQLSMMILPGIDMLLKASTNVLLSLIFIGILNPQLLLTPLLFLICFVIAIRFYQKQLTPVMGQMRQQLGIANAILTETITGIEVIKATSQEEQEKEKFRGSIIRYRDLFVQNGLIEGRYFATLLLGIFLVLAFLHGLYLLLQGTISPGTLIAFVALTGSLNMLTSLSVFTFITLQWGMASAQRILGIMQEETEVDENKQGHQTVIKGDIRFENVSFSYENSPVLKHVSFHICPGQTVAIVGQTGAGKSTLTKLINRIYDVDEGRVLIDDVDVREWNIDTLRSQISTIEQDIFLFARSIVDNITYGLGQQASQAAVETVAEEAQAHEFIMGFKEGYQTVIGPRGATLSGGQRQRIAIARALLTNPRILLLDDSTSAIDSSTEDKIQTAIQRVEQERTTILITHRLSQIRWADLILVIEKGALIDYGVHEELLLRCSTYQRIFSRYGSASQNRVFEME